MEGSAIPPDDREALKRFFERLRVLLDHLARDPDDLFRPELRPLMEAAWEELVAEGRFEDLERAIESGEYDQGILDHGLRGAQLKFKVATFDSSLEDVQKAERKRFFTRKNLRKAVPGALQSANVIVDSVAAFVPPAGLVKEFKMAAEAAITKGARIKDAVVGLIPRRKKRREAAELVGAP